MDLAAQRAALEKGGLGPNVALLIGHGAVRSAVIGGANRAPDAGGTRADAGRWCASGMEQGAFGLSSGLFYTPGSYAKTEEVIELTKVAAERGGLYTSHVRDEGELQRRGRRRGRGGHPDRRRSRGPSESSVTRRRSGPTAGDWRMRSRTGSTRARPRGVQVFADQYPYEASSTSLRAALLPDGVRGADGRAPGEAGVDDRGAEGGLRRGPRQVATENLRRRGGPAAILIAHYRPDPSLEGKSLAHDRGGAEAGPPSGRRSS